MSVKLSINEKKILKILEKDKVISQSNLFVKFEGEYSSSNSKRAVISVALKKLKAKNMIKLKKTVEHGSRIPENVWEKI